jgi:asparagine synthase (glutamine-hydrolysing)
LYFYQEQGCRLVFGSETIQFKHLQGYQRVANPACVSVAVQNPWMLEGTGKTIYSGIRQVRPGHYLSVRANGDITETRWWDTSANLTAIPENYNQQVTRFRELFEDAVRIRLRSDVSIGSALSGGLDSSAVYSTIHHLKKDKEAAYRLPADWQRAFVAVFPGTEQDEQEYAQKVLQHTKGEGVFFDMMNSTHGLTDRLIKSIHDYDVIYSTPLMIMDGVYGTMKANGVTVSMDGHGVDEMLYGYSFNVFEAYHYARQLKDEAYAADLYNTYMSMLPEAERIQKEQEFRNNNIRPSFLSRQVNRVRRKLKLAAKQNWWVDPAILQAFAPSPFQIPASFQGSEAALYQAFHYTALPTILRNFDLGAMRNGIEIRMPFLDYRLVSYVFSLPMKSKLGNGFTKRILRDAMQQVLPEEIRTRKLKIGFNAPLLTWYKHNLKQFILDEANSTSFKNSSFWNGKRICAFVEEKYKNNSWTEPECFRVWSFLNAHILLHHK